MNEEQVLIARLQDLAKRAYRQNIYTYTGFLTPAELAVVYEKQADFSFVGMTCFGGTPECERQMVQFGSEELFGYAGVFPISIILVEPLLDKFAEDLSHRDFLGALMNLGIERSVLGDILVKDGKRAYIFCQENIAAYIMEQLTKVEEGMYVASIPFFPTDKRTYEIEDLKPVLEDIHVIVSAPRFDAIVAAVTKCSRNETLDIFRAKKVTRNGRIEERNSLVLKDGDSFSVRGYGKFRYCGAGSETRKGRVNIYLKKYI